MLSSFNSKNTTRERVENFNQFVIFKIADKEFGVDITQTREIIEATELTFIPNAPDFVNGVINLRGEIVPVVDLYNRLGLHKEKNNEQDKKVIIISLGSSLVGMKVDDVQEIIRLSEDQVKLPPDITRGIKKDYVTGVGKLEGRLLILLDLNNILTREEVEELDNIELE